MKRRMFFDPPTHLNNSNSLENQQESDYIFQEKISAQNHQSFSKNTTFSVQMQAGGVLVVGIRAFFS